MNIDGAPRSIIVCRAPEGSDPRPEPNGADAAFHRLRERVERRAAKQATSLQSRRIHQELAQAHSEMAEKATGLAGR